MIYDNFIPKDIIFSTTLNSDADKIQQLEKENAELKTANKEFTEDYKLQQKAINTLNESGLKLMEENKDLKYRLANQKYLDQIEVEKVFDDCLPQEYNNNEEKIITMEDETNIITAICNLVLIDRDKIAEVLNDYTSTLECSKCGNHIMEIIVSESFDLLADEIISVAGGK